MEHAPRQTGLNSSLPAPVRQLLRGRCRAVGREEGNRRPTRNPQSQSRKIEDDNIIPIWDVGLVMALVALGVTGGISA